MTENFVHGVFSFLALACLLGLFYTAWQSLVVDAVRQRMFEIRDNAFLWAYDNKCLNDEEYKKFREVTNLAIRHFESTSVIKLLTLNKFFNFDKRASASKDVFPQDTHFKKEFSEVTKVAVRGLYLRSLLMMAPFFFLLPVIGLLSLLNNGGGIIPRRVTRTLSREIEAEIFLAEAI